MNAPIPMRAAVIVVLFAVGMIATAAYSLRHAPDRVRQIERRHEEWSELRALAARLAADQSVLAAATREGGAPPLAEWFRAQRPTWPVELKDAESERVTADWSLSRMQVTIPRVALAELGETLVALARGPAPWRAVELNLSAIDAEPGFARAVLTLEGLARAPVATP